MIQQFQSVYQRDSMATALHAVVEYRVGVPCQMSRYRKWDPCNSGVSLGHTKNETPSSAAGDSVT